MILIIAMGIVFIINPMHYTSVLFRSNEIVLIIGLISIIIGLYCIYQFGRKLIDRNAKLYLDDKGICDSVNILDYPFIQWENILKIEECKINNIPHLKIILKNSQQYISQITGFKKWILSLNYKKYRTPILLNSVYLSCSFEEFKKSVFDFYEEYKI